MPPQISSPTRPLRSKRDSSTISRSVGKALADVMNKDKESTVASSSTESEPTGNSGTPVKTRALTASAKPGMATIREGSRAGRPSLDTPRSSSRSDKSTPKLTKAPLSKPITRSQTTTASHIGEKSPKKAVEKPAKPRASSTLRRLSAALQPKPGPPPSALPKYKPKCTTESLGVGRSSTRKRLSDWDAEVAEEKDQEMTVDATTSDDDADDDFVTVDRPISPLPRRATRMSILPSSLSLMPPTPRKAGNVLHKVSSSLSSTPPRAFKTAKTSVTSTSPIARLQPNQSRPPSAASVNSQRATPVQSPRKLPSSSRAKTTPSARSVQRRPALVDSSTSNGSKLESSPATPFQLPETSGSSLLSPPLSPFLDGVSIDSIDANDVSALLPTIVSPVHPIPTPSHASRKVPSQAPSGNLHVFPRDINPPPPQTPASSRTISSLTTDPRQSVLSLRQFLENSADLEHLLSQPLPSLLTPDARERLLSFGFSPGLSPIPFSSASVRPEPQTPSPVPDGQTFTSISQVLFPRKPAPPSTEQQRPVPDTAPDSQTPRAADLDGNLVETLKRKLTTAELQRTECDARIESLEKQLAFLREAREREAAELSTQVTDLEAKLQGLLGDRELEAERRASEVEERLRDKDAEWERLVMTAVAQVQEQDLADRERTLRLEQRRGGMRSAAIAWERAREIACSELELLRCNKRFVEVTLAGLDVTMHQLRQ